ncbi:MAG TPA: TetR/AcrR family transcriptional regulator [Terriglobales bacterium]|nr:TetR/AcrR family transcriptional regulator [Terriglobales bacterium]
MSGIRAARPPGRPRSFNSEEALDRALEVFRRKGYEGASLSDLTKAMGINRPSMYAAFGDKENLFRKALDRYTEQTKMYMREAMQEKTARAFIERLLRGAAEWTTDCRRAPGCLTVTGALACGDESQPIRKELICRRSQNEQLIFKRLKQARKSGELPAECKPSDLSRYFATVLQGMAVQAASGTSRAELLRVVETSLIAWPE